VHASLRRGARPAGDRGCWQARLKSMPGVFRRQNKSTSQCFVVAPKTSAPVPSVLGSTLRSTGTAQKRAAPYLHIIYRRLTRYDYDVQETLARPSFEQSNCWRHSCRWGHCYNVLLEWMARNW
jgi:hypothetical protein